MYLLDSSAIIILLKKFRKEAVKYIEGKYTLSLAKFELGNVIWKECVLRSIISFDDALGKVKYVAKILRIMQVLDINSPKDFHETMELAINHKLTFYDSAYLYIAKKHKLILVTEDVELRERSEKAGVEAINVDKYISVFNAKAK